jgi:small conductance mechanosensitive channel
LEILGVDEFAASQITIKIRLKTAPIKQWRVGREFRRRMKKAFDARDVEIPFPHLTLYFGASKQGDAPPLRVALDSLSTVKHVGEQNTAIREGV